jgi:hypothetical protein
MIDRTGTRKEWSSGGMQRALLDPSVTPFSARHWLPQLRKAAASHENFNTATITSSITTICQRRGRSGGQAPLLAE